MLEDQGLLVDGRWLGSEDAAPRDPRDVAGARSRRGSTASIPCHASSSSERPSRADDSERRRCAHLPPRCRPTRSEPAIASLDRSGLVQPEDEAGGRWRFAHALVLEAAYRGLSKGQRAELHEQLADWLSRWRTPIRPTSSESVARHLERALHLREELGAARRALAASRAACRRAVRRRRARAPSPPSTSSRPAISSAVRRCSCRRGPAPPRPAPQPRRRADRDGPPRGDRGAALGGRRAEPRGRVRARRAARDDPAALEPRLPLAHRGRDRRRRHGSGSARSMPSTPWRTTSGSPRPRSRSSISSSCAGAWREQYEWTIRALRHGLAAGRLRESAQAAADFGLLRRRRTARRSIASPRPPRSGCSPSASRSRGSAGHALMAIGSLAAGDEAASLEHERRWREVIDRHGLGWLGAAHALVIADVETWVGNAEAAERRLREARDVLVTLGDIWWVATLDSSLCAAVGSAGASRRSSFGSPTRSTHPPPVPDRQLVVRRSLLRSRAFLLRGSAADAEAAARRGVESVRPTDLVARPRRRAADARRCPRRPRSRGGGHDRARRRHRAAARQREPGSRRQAWKLRCVRRRHPRDRDFTSAHLTFHCIVRLDDRLDPITPRSRASRRRRRTRGSPCVSRAGASRRPRTAARRRPTPPARPGPDADPRARPG